MWDIADKENEPTVAKKARGRPPKHSVSEDAGDAIKMVDQHMRDDDAKKLREKDAIITDLTEKLKSSDEEIKILRDDNDDKDEQIKNLTEIVAQKEKDYRDLLEQLDNLDTFSAEAGQPANKRLKALLVCDEITESIFRYLCDKFEWSHADSTAVLRKVDELCDNYDVVFIMTGSTDLCEGTAWTTLVANTSFLYNEISDAGVTAYIVALPPANKRNLSSMISLVNYKLEKQYSDRFVDVVAATYAKSSLLQENGTHLSEHGAKIVADLINKNIIPLTLEMPEKPAKKPRRTVKQPKSQESNIKLFVDVNKDDVGKVIGRGGHIVKRLAADNKVTINIGKWFEKSGRTSDDYKEVCSGIIVKGDVDDAMNTRAAINKICESK
jgi:transcription antitermination factor NusA-like protein